MFETTDEAELPMHEELTSFGSRAWETVKLRLHIPWFFVNCGMKYSAGPQLQEIRLLSTPDKLCELKKSKVLKILEVYLVSPAILNGTKHWRMDQLVQIWQVDDLEDSSVPSFVYGLCDGRRYNYLGLDASQFGTENMKLIFEIT